MLMLLFLNVASITDKFQLPPYHQGATNTR